MLKRLLELIVSVVVGVIFGFLLRLMYYANIEKIGQYIPASVPVIGGIVIGIIFFYFCAFYFICDFRKNGKS